jgi:hypothetical protein
MGPRWGGGEEELKDTVADGWMQQTLEVQTARVYNYDVQLKRREKAEAEKEGGGEKM